MNIDRPHDIQDGKELTTNGVGKRCRYIPLTDDEYQRLEFAGEEERHEFVRAMPTKERLARWLESEEAPSWIVYHARRGKYDDFDDNGAELPQIELVKDLKSAGRYDLSRPIIDGVFDASADESKAWAARQVGETKAILDVLDSVPKSDDMRKDFMAAAEALKKRIKP